MTKLKFISEIASTHNGSEKYLKKITENIINGKSDYIKFQIFNNSDLCHKSSKFYLGLKKIEIKKKFWKKIINYSLYRKKTILEPFDKDSYDFCKIFRKKALLKISSSEHDNMEIIEDSLNNFQKVFFNISGFNKKKIDFLISKFRKYKKKIVLMYGFQSFPSKPKDLRLNIINDLKKIRKIEVGYADHSLTDDEFQTYILTAKAIDYGAKYIEKHITLKRSEKKPDYISSFEPKDFNKYVDFFKNKYISRFGKNISESEKKYCNVMEKFAVANCNINKSEEIDLKKIKFLRINKKGLNFNYIRNLIKKKKIFKKKINLNEILKINHFS